MNHNIPSLVSVLTDNPDDREFLIELYNAANEGDLIKIAGFLKRFEELKVPTEEVITLKNQINMLQAKTDKLTEGIRKCQSELHQLITISPQVN